MTYKPNGTQEQRFKNVRICTKCHEVKLITEFYGDKRRSGGLRSECKSCDKKYDHKRYFSDQPRFLKQKRDYYYKNADKVAKRSRKYNAEHKDHLFQMTYKRNKKYRETEGGTHKFSARMKIWYYLKRGKLVKQPCKVCGDIKSFAHHYLGYEPEHWLDVEWLCRKHHAETQRKDYLT